MDFTETQTGTVADLAVGDFIIEITGCRGIAGANIRSAVTSLTLDYDTFHFYQRSSRRKVSVPVDSRKMTFVTGEPMNFPVTFTVTYRRPVGR